ncbi:MAG TPA: hypothetical protein VFM18_10700 [Methanosarcina sp.]|nr:hypothetical protein [Methanosarcina sp.]
MKEYMNPSRFLVGGAVRDLAMGIMPQDRDYVIVGANHDWMIENGYRDIGSVDFPVYHDVNGDEFALARREKKVGTGYHGFITETDSVTLEMDQQRRDLTINSMALDSKGRLIDPFNGMQDIKDKILRHVSHHFAEDPLRVLRLARFAARYNFTVHPETIEFCRQIVRSGELETIDNNRLWKEIRRAVHEPYFPRFFEVLHDVDALYGDVRLAKMTSNKLGLFGVLKYWTSEFVKYPTDMLIANYFNVDSSVGASNMSIQLHKMFNQYVILTNQPTESNLIEYILKHRLHQECEKVETFFIWLDMNDLVRYGEDCKIASSAIKKVVDIMKQTDVQSIIETKLTGLKLKQAIRDVHLKNVMEKLWN